MCPVGPHLVEPPAQRQHLFPVLIPDARPAACQLGERRAGSLKLGELLVPAAFELVGDQAAAWVDLVVLLEGTTGFGRPKAFSRASSCCPIRAAASRLARMPSGEIARSASSAKSVGRSVGRRSANAARSHGNPDRLIRNRRLRVPSGAGGGASVPVNAGWTKRLRGSLAACAPMRSLSGSRAEGRRSPWRWPRSEGCSRRRCGPWA